MYPNSGALAYGCGVCHQAALPALNRYGDDFANNVHDFHAIEPLDSDGDGYSNISEIDLGTNPGDATSHSPEPPPMFSLPVGQNSIIYPPVTSPIVSPYPTFAKPIGTGAIARGGNTVGVLIGLDPFVAPVDIYLAIYMPAIDPINIYILTQTGPQILATDNLAPWIQNTTAPLNATLLYGVPALPLPPGVYSFALMVTPHGSMNDYYLWITSFVKP